MVATMIRHIITIKRDARSAHVLGHDDADTAARYAGALLQYRDTTLADLYEARIHLEAAAVETLATKRSPGDLRRLDVAIAESEAALPDPIAYRAKHELQFHRLLIELADNQTMITLADMLMSIIELHNLVPAPAPGGRGIRGRRTGRPSRPRQGRRSHPAEGRRPGSHLLGPVPALDRRAHDLRPG
jgi:hypothetical protein